MFRSMPLLPSSQLLISFDPFCDDFQVQHVAQRNDGHRDCFIIRVCRDVTNEGLIDLQRS